MGAASHLTDPAPLRLSRANGTNGVVHLDVAGEIDLASADQLTSAISVIVHEAGVTALLVDFQKLVFLDSSGIAALVAGYRAAGAQGVGFRVINCSGSVRHVLEVTGVYGVLAGDGE